MKTYIVHSSHTAYLAPSFVAVVQGRQQAERVAREASTNGREAVVNRQTDGYTVAAYHSGRAMPVSDVYLNYRAMWQELYGIDADTLAATVARLGVTA